MRKKLSDLKIPPDVPRADAGEVEGLALSVREHGLLVPVTIEHDGTVRAGVRRLAALKALGKEEVECLLMPPGANPGVAQLVDNIQRKNLSPVEEARAFRRMLDRTGWKQVRLAREIGVSEAHVSLALNLLEAPRDVLDSVERGEQSAYDVECAYSKAGRRDGRAEKVRRRVRSGGTVPARFCSSFIRVPSQKLPPGLRARVFSDRLEISFAVGDDEIPLEGMTSLAAALKSALGDAEPRVLEALREARSRVLHLDGLGDEPDER